MTAHHSYIDHKGVVHSLDSKNVFVALEKTSACSTCSAKGACGIGESSVTIYRIEKKDGTPTLQIGDDVIIRMQVATGFFALLWAYMVPFALVIVTLFTGLWLSMNEGRAGLLALLVLIPYYIMLSFKKNFLHRRLDLQILRQ